MGIEYIISLKFMFKFFGRIWDFIFSWFWLLIGVVFNLNGVIKFCFLLLIVVNLGIVSVFWVLDVMVNSLLLFSIFIWVRNESVVNGYGRLGKS